VICRTLVVNATDLTRNLWDKICTIHYNQHTCVCLRVRWCGGAVCARVRW
jgi:hypothetical protein